MKEKMTVTWIRWVKRLAAQEDVDREQKEWREFHGRYGHPPGWVPVELGDEIDVEEQIELPGKYEVCGRCQGKGSHMNPAIDGHGITAEEWWGPDWDDESREMYMNGGYDVTCHRCDGHRVVLVVDKAKIEQSLLKEYLSDMDRRAHEDYVERRMRWAEEGGRFNEY